MMINASNWQQFVHDKDVTVRIAVAQQGYGLDILVNDEDPLVRAEVAFQGYALDILKNDPKYDVRKVAEIMLKKA